MCQCDCDPYSAGLGQIIGFSNYNPGSILNGWPYENAAAQNPGMLGWMGISNIQAQMMMHDPSAGQYAMVEQMKCWVEHQKRINERILAKHELIDDVWSQTPHLLDYCL